MSRSSLSALRGLVFAALSGCSLVLDPSGFVGSGRDGGESLDAESPLDVGSLDAGDLDAGVLDAAESDVGPCEMCGGDECVDLATDPDHCGGCPRACAALEGCVSGGCVPGAVDTLSGAAGKDSIRGIATSPDGMVCITGVFTTYAAFQPASLASAPTALNNMAGGSAGFLVCQPPGSGRTWSAVFRASSAVATAVAVDERGVVVAGNFEGALTVVSGGSDTTVDPVGGSDIFVATFPLAGSSSPQIRVVGGTGQESVDALVLTPTSTCIGGTFEGRLNLSGVVEESVGEDGFVQCVPRETGMSSTSRTFNGGGFSRVLGLATDGSQLVAVGEFSAELSAAKFVAAGASDGFAVGLSMGLSVLWQTQIGGSGEDAARAVGFGSGGAAIIGGTCAGVALASSPTVDCEANGDGFVLALDSGGRSLWSHRISGTAQADGVFAVAADTTSGDILFGGEYRGEGAIDGMVALPLSRDVDGFVGTLTSTGALVELVSMGGGAADRVVAAWMPPSRELLFAADYQGMAMFPGGTAMSMGGTDSVLVRAPASHR